MSSHAAVSSDASLATSDEKSAHLSTGADAALPDLHAVDSRDPGADKDGSLRDIRMPDKHWISWGESERPGHTAYSATRPEVQERASTLDNTELRGGWVPHTHPNGAIYYENEVDKITSDFDLRRTEKEHEIFVHDLKTSCAYDYRQDHWWVNLTRRDGETGFIWIDHETMSASTFNQKASDFKRHMDREDVVARLERQRRYWTYVQDHPNHIRPLGNSVFQEAYDALSWCYADRLLFKHTNATFSKEDSKDLLDMLERLQDRSVHGSLRNWFIASTLRAIVSDRQGTHHGLHDAPKYRQREVDDMTATFEELAWPMKLLYYVFGVIVFLGIPHTYFRRVMDVDRTRFDDGVNAMRWKAFLHSLLKEWSDSNLLATVLISATVAFLALPGLEDNSRMLGLFSVLLAIGSVLVGMFFVWNHQPRAESSADVGLNYFLQAKYFTDSSVPLAFILSVPVVLLLWSFLCFITAILVFAFHGTQQRLDPAVTIKFSRATSPTTLAMFCLVLACAAFAWMFMWRVWTRRRKSRGGSHRDDMPGTVWRFPSLRLFPRRHKDSGHRSLASSPNAQGPVVQVPNETRDPISDSFAERGPFIPTGGSTYIQGSAPIPSTQAELAPAGSNLPVHSEAPHEEVIATPSRQRLAVRMTSRPASIEEDSDTIADLSPSSPNFKSVSPNFKSVSPNSKSVYWDNPADDAANTCRPNLSQLLTEEHYTNDGSPSASRLVARRTSSIAPRQTRTLPVSLARGGLGRRAPDPVPTAPTRSHEPTETKRRKSRLRAFAVGNVRQGRKKPERTTQSMRDAPAMPQTPSRHRQYRAEPTLEETQWDSSSDSADGTSDERWQSPSTVPSDGALFGAINVVSATVHAPRPQSPAQEYGVAVAQRGTAPHQIVASHAPMSHDLTSKGAPHLPAIAPQPSLNFDNAFSHPATVSRPSSVHNLKAAFATESLPRRASWNDLRSTTKASSGKGVGNTDVPHARRSNTNGDTVFSAAKAKTGFTAFRIRQKSSDPSNLV